MTRRDQCHLVGKRAAKLDPMQAAAAWYYLAGRVEAMGAVERMDIPKFRHLLRAVRRATILAKSPLTKHALVR
jgi:hypothetical protein